MRTGDHKQHHKPHIHAQYAAYEASVALDGELLAGEIPSKKLALVQAWITLREDELYAAWNNAVQNIQPPK
jgi:hypothetical protein